MENPKSELNKPDKKSKAESPKPDKDLDKDSKNILRFFIYSAIAIFILWYFFVKKDAIPYNSTNYGNTQLAASSEKLPDTTTAYLVAQQLMNNRLNSPEFRSTPVVFVKNDNDSTYKILSFVYTQNDRGIKFKNNFTIRMQYRGGDETNPTNWLLQSLDFTDG